MGGALSQEESIDLVFGCPVRLVNPTMECMSSLLSSTFGEGNRQRLEVPIYQRQCKVLLLWKILTERKLTFPDTVSRDTGIKVEDLPAALENKTVWCQSVRNITATTAR